MLSQIRRVRGVAILDLMDAEMVPDPATGNPTSTRQVTEVRHLARILMEFAQAHPTEFLILNLSSLSKLTGWVHQDFVDVAHTVVRDLHKTLFVVGVPAGWQVNLERRYQGTFTVFATEAGAVAQALRESQLRAEAS